MGKFLKFKFSGFIVIILLVIVALSILHVVFATAPNPGHNFTESSGGVAQGDLLYGSAADTLSALAKSATAGMFLSNSGTSNNPAWATPLGYTITVQALTSSPADGATVYFGELPKAPVTAAGTSKIYIREAGTIKVAEIYVYSGTAGTNQAWSLYIRKNNTTDTLIATVGAATNERVFSNTGLSIAVAAGDYFEIKSVQPTWATNPATTIYGGYIYIE